MRQSLRNTSDAVSLPIVITLKYLMSLMECEDICNQTHKWSYLALFMLCYIYEIVNYVIILSKIFNERTTKYYWSVFYVTTK